MLQCDDSIMNNTHTTHSLLSIDCMVPHPPKQSDVSGSMGIEATVKTQDGGSLESTGLNRLDIVKHAIRTVATTLQETDTLAIVSFEASANVALPLTRMGSEPSKALVSKTLDTLHPSGGTNLWGGLEAGFALLDSRSEGVGVLLLLTDGQPNTCAHPGGELGALDDHLASQSRRSGVDRGDSAAAAAGDKSVVVSTFGFGYDLNSALLLAIAQRCGGSYTFVPDAGFVGEPVA
jgi:Mg-chelatase subunit ChlD